jgi:hypothetical protein
MKATKSLLALSILAACGSAHATTWDVTMHADNYFGGLSGQLVMNFTGTYNDAASVTWVDDSSVSHTTLGKGTWTGNTHAANPDGVSAPLVPMDLTYTQDFIMAADGTGRLNALYSCTQTTGGACSGFGPALQGDFWNTAAPLSIGHGSPGPTTGLDAPLAFSPTDGGVYTWTLQVYKAVGKTFVYLPLPLTVTLHAQGGGTPEVPVPAAAWLFGSGLLGLAGTARRRRVAATAA